VISAIGQPQRERIRFVCDVVRHSVVIVVSVLLVSSKNINMLRGSVADGGDNI